MNPTKRFALLFILIISSASFADDKKKGKERVYEYPLDKVYAACLKTAAEDNVIEFSDKEAGIITYKSGQSASSWGFKVSVVVSEVEGNKTKVKLTTQKTKGQLFAWGAGDRTANKFFEALEKNLKEEK